MVGKNYLCPKLDYVVKHTGDYYIGREIVFKLRSAPISQANIHLLRSLAGPRLLRLLCKIINWLDLPSHLEICITVVNYTGNVGHARKCGQKSTTSTLRKREIGNLSLQIENKRNDKESF